MSVVRRGDKVSTYYVELHLRNLMELKCRFGSSSHLFMCLSAVENALKVDGASRCELTTYLPA